MEQGPENDTRQYYIFDQEEEKPQGPFTEDEVREHATAESLVSNSDQWVRFDEHPSFVEPPNGGSPSTPPPPPPPPMKSQEESEPPGSPSAIEPKTDTLPNETGDVGMFRGFSPTLMLFLTEPRVSYRKLQNGRALLPPIIYAGIILAVIGIELWIGTNLIWSKVNDYVAAGVNQAASEVIPDRLTLEFLMFQLHQDPDFQQLKQSWDSIPQAIFLISLLILVVHVVACAIRTFFVHLLFKGFRGSNPDVKTTVRVALYASTPNILLTVLLAGCIAELLFSTTLVPTIAFLGLPIAWLAWTVFMEAAGFGAAYEMGRKKTLIAVGVPHAVIAGLTAIVTVISVLVAIGGIEAASQTAAAYKNQAFEQCITDAHTQYSAKWDLVCQQIGKAPECALPNDLATVLNNELETAKQACAEAHGQLE